MTPERAQIMAVDDDKGIIRCYTRWLEGQEHTIVLSANSVAEALQKIPEAIQLGVQVAIVDGRIPSNPNDGEEVAIALKKAIPEIKIFSVCGRGKKPEWADAHMDKADMDLAGFREIIRSL